MAATLVAAACSGDGGDDAQVEASGGAEAGGAAAAGSGESAAAPLSAIEEAVSGAGPLIRDALILESDTLSDVQVAIDMYDQTETVLGGLRRQLPDTVEPDATGSYSDFVAYVDEWRTTATASRGELDDRRGELQAALDEYGGLGAEGPPPSEYTDLLDRNFLAAEQFGPLCAQMAADLGITPDCFAAVQPAGPPPGAGPEPGDFADGGVVTVEIGAFEGELDLGPVMGRLIEPDFVGIDLGPAATLTITPPPDVADPAALGARLTDAVPWPDDPGAWLAALPVQVVDESEAALGPSTAATWTFRRTGSDDVAVIANPKWPADQAYVLRGGETLRVWDGELAGQPVVAVLYHDDPVGPFEPWEQRAQEILTSMRPAG